MRTCNASKRACGASRYPFGGAAVAAAEVERLASGIKFGVAKIIMTRGSGQRGYRPPRDAVTPVRIVGVLPAQPGAVRIIMSMGLRCATARLR